MGLHLLSTMLLGVVSRVMARLVELVLQWQQKNFVQTTIKVQTSTPFVNRTRGCAASTQQTRVCTSRLRVVPMASMVSANPAVTKSFLNHRKDGGCTTAAMQAMATHTGK